jgi:hypothetical protein
MRGHHTFISPMRSDFIGNTEDVQRERVGAILLCQSAMA